MPQHLKTVQKEREALSVEQLLRLKKAEQPELAFWNQFEKQMHHRMFQAAMHSRPGFAPLSNYNTWRTGCGCASCIRRGALHAHFAGNWPWPDYHRQRR